MSLFIIFKLSSIFFPLADSILQGFLKLLPGSDRIEEKSIKRILSDFVYIIIVILIGVALGPSLSKITPYAINIINFLELLIIIILIYDAGKTSYILIEEETKRLKNKKSKKKIKRSDN